MFIFKDCPHCDKPDCLPKSLDTSNDGRIGDNCRHCNGSLYLDIKNKKVLSILLPSQASVVL